MWKEIDGTKYEVSNQGQIRNIESKKIIKTFFNKGYVCVRLFVIEAGKEKNFRVHRLVAKYFKDNFQEHLDVHHLNGIRHDNRDENLSCIPSRENQKSKNKTFNRFITYLDGKDVIQQIISLYQEGLSVDEIHKTFRELK